jgi:hypothetical protein
VEECKLRVSEWRVLRRMFGPKRDEVRGVRIGQALLNTAVNL